MKLKPPHRRLTRPIYGKVFVGFDLTILVLPTRPGIPTLNAMLRILLTALVAFGAGCLGSETVDQSTPVVLITSPSGTVVTGTVRFSATAVDDYGVEKVEFFAGETRLAEDLAEPYEVQWNTLSHPDGDIQLRVVATDLSGNTGQAAKTVTVNNATPN